MPHPGNLKRDLIKMPFVADPRPATTDLVGGLLTELTRPLSYSFMADDDATGGQQLLYHAETEREAEIQRTPWPMISAGKRYPA
jgi:hypothetical protein